MPLYCRREVTLRPLLRSCGWGEGAVRMPVRGLIGVLLATPLPPLDYAYRPPTTSISCMLPIYRFFLMFVAHLPHPYLTCHPLPFWCSTRSTLLGAG